MSRRTSGGMTLIEVLISITLLSLLAVGMLFAIRTGLGAMEASQRRLLANRRTTNAQRVLAAQVAGFLPVMARCGASAVQSDGPVMPFFFGMPTVMRFVSSYSLQGAWRGEPQIVEMFVISGENGQGVRLVENETPYRGPVGAGFFCQAPGAPTQMGMPEVRPDSFVLADKLAECRFLYKDEPPAEAGAEFWRPAWDPMASGWPRAIRIEMQPLERQAMRIPPMTFTGRIHVTRRPGEKYAF
jgi:prepilin-type N-terminal cleavage/methylation domain-containing protein